MSNWGALRSTSRPPGPAWTSRCRGRGRQETQPDRPLFGSYFNSKLKAAVQSGEVATAQLNRMVRHVLTAMFRIGLFDHPTPDPATVLNSNVSTPAHQQLSTRIATQGSVLLKNRAGAAPV